MASTNQNQLSYSKQTVIDVMEFAREASHAAWVVWSGSRNYGEARNMAHDKCEKIFNLLSDAAVGDDLMQECFNAARAGYYFYVSDVHGKSAIKRNKERTPTLTNDYVKELYALSKEVLRYADADLGAAMRRKAQYIETSIQQSVTMAHQAEAKQGLAESMKQDL